ncbi:hypothetical protein OCUBac02_53600 (plasmid) [Bosea sp. ANAM02]|nr:hypothetical protein OCUBac02_53600 [Bosea sp. ANAM02]
MDEGLDVGLADAVGAGAERNWSQRDMLSARLQKDGGGVLTAQGKGFRGGWSRDPVSLHRVGLQGSPGQRHAPLDDASLVEAPQMAQATLPALSRR